MDISLTKTELEYQKTAMGFAAYGDNPHYPCYGLGEEISELIAAIGEGDRVDVGHVCGELGDITWMIAAICKEFGMPFCDVVLRAKERTESHLGVVIDRGDALVDCAKSAFALSAISGSFYGKLAKFIRKNDGIDPKVARGWATKEKAVEQFAGDVENMFVEMFVRIIEIGWLLGLGLDDVMDENIRKLTERKRTGTIVGSGESVAERKANAAKGV